jgi:hypothetical protein
LKIIIRTEIIFRCPGFNEKLNVAKFWRQKEGVSRATLGAGFVFLNFDLLLAGVLLRVVVHDPTEGDEKFVNAILARLSFGKFRREVISFAGFENGNRLLPVGMFPRKALAFVRR